MHGCSYKTFMNCKPHSFKGTEGVVGLKRWFEKIEQVFEICKCAEDDKVKFAMCTFEGRALTWWNGNVQTLGLANANQIPWSNVKAMMTTEYCPATEIEKMEQELWTLTLKGDDIEAYSNRFHELVLMCPELMPTESKKIGKYIRGFPEGIKGNMISSKPATLHEAINMARALVEQSVQGNVKKWVTREGIVASGFRVHGDVLLLKLDLRFGLSSFETSEIEEYSKSAFRTRYGHLSSQRNYANVPADSTPDVTDDFVNVYCDASKTRFWMRADAQGNKVDSIMRQDNVILLLRLKSNTRNPQDFFQQPEEIPECEMGKKLEMDFLSTKLPKSQQWFMIRFGSLWIELDQVLLLFLLFVSDTTKTEKLAQRFMSTEIVARLVVRRKSFQTVMRRFQVTLDGKPSGSIGYRLDKSTALPPSDRSVRSDG
ncbi:retrotransposon protein, putative, ty3-gypsy subclass [Tanacetum coccineum]